LPLNFHISHTTSYFYNKEVFESRNLIKVFPIKDKHQKVISHSISVTGNPPVKSGKDIFGNKFGIFTLYEGHSKLIINSTMDVQTRHRNLIWNASKGHQSWDDMRLLGLDSSFRLFLSLNNISPMPDIWAVVNSYPIGQMTPLEVVLAFNKYVNLNFLYNPWATLVDTPLDIVWKLKAGVCQDFSHVLIYMLRSANIPARYVSGYICPNNDGMRGDGATHAWVEAYLPNFGWLGVDPTNNCVANEKHVRVAVGRDYQDVAPVVGKFKGNAYQTLEVKVTVDYYPA
jgi:transglutaminase-like putative cysteine protease